ncbi:MAG: calcium/sodium antiporter [Thermoplasmata archaeon]
MVLGLLGWTLFLAAGVVILVKGADMMVDGGAKTAAYFGVPAIIIGLTLVSFGTSLPELASSLNAISKGKHGISVGNVIGSNIANILLVLGVSSIISPISVDRKIVQREVPIMFGAMSLLIIFSSGLVITRWEGLILLIAFSLFVVFFVYIAVHSDERVLIRQEIQDEEYMDVTDYDTKRDVGKIVLGIAGIVLGSEMMIRGGIFYMEEFHLSEGVVGLSIIALATSLPELAASSMAAYKKESGISIGNVIGSNIFNILMVLGICAVVSPLNFTGEIIPNIMIMLAASVILTVFMYTGHKISRREGAAMLAGYFLYLFYLYHF